MDLCIALDMHDWDSNVKLVGELCEIDNLCYKIGIRSLLSGDIKSLIRSIRLANDTSKIFLDLNLFDIPYNMSYAVNEALSLNINMLSINVHCGLTSLQAASNALYAFKPKSNNHPILIASTVLTSITENVCTSIYDDTIRRTCIKLTEMASHGKISGVYCPPTEIKAIKALTSTIDSSFITICSGIRSSMVDGHVNYTDLFDAYYSGASMVVLGRPIYTRKNPFGEVVIVLDKISKLGDPNVNSVPF